MRAENSRGRRYPEQAHPYRSEYARDRDRIVHARAFRRLEAKTQVFTARFSDHFRNRLTHTLEVSQIARTVAHALALNTELVEALALVHDIGHPPFGHAGERKLDELMRAHGGRFDHNLHALRIVEQFEHRYLGFAGLNLTFEVREGIVKHSRDYHPAEFPELSEYLLDASPAAGIPADRLGGRNCVQHRGPGRCARSQSSGSAIRCAGKCPFFGEMYAKVDANHPGALTKLKFNEALRHALDLLVTDLIDTPSGRSAIPGATDGGGRSPRAGAPGGHERHGTQRRTRC